MKTVIVFESMFGNTEHFAKEIAEGLADAGAEPTAGRRPQRPTGRSPRLRPARRRRPHTRLLHEPPVDEGGRGAARCDPGRAAVGIREWLPTLDDVFPSASERPVVAVFDTRVEKVRRLPGSAAKRAARVLRAHGFALLERPISFYVADVKGPATFGEIFEAHTWAARPGRVDGSGRRKMLLTLSPGPDVLRHHTQGLVALQEPAPAEGWHRRERTP